MKRPSAWRQRIAPLAIALAAGLLASALTLNLSLLKALENAAADLRIALLQPPEPQSPEIVVAAITEETLAGFAYRSPVDRGFLAKLLRDLQAKGVRGIGVDVLFDSPTEPDKDALLARTLREMQVPVFVSYTVTPSIVNEEQLAYMNRFVPETMRAAANLATDPLDGNVRWIFPGGTEPGMPVGFARKGAAIAGVSSRPGWQAIAWRPKAPDGAEPFPMFPAHAIAMMPDAWFKNKIVLVGAVLSITDRHRTSLTAHLSDGDGTMPGVMVQAHALSQLIEGRKPHQASAALTIAVSLLLALLGTGIGLLGRSVAAKVGLGTGAALLLWVGSFYGFGHGLPLLPLLAPTLALAIALWMTDALTGRAERRQRQFIQAAFARYVAPAVVDRLVADPDSLAIAGTRQEVSFIFTDIAGFTTLSEELPSDRLAALLNDYLDGACQIILRHMGTIDKFIGDAIMSVFNAPLEQPDHALRAVRCALELDAYFEAFRARTVAEGIPLGVTRIGIHTGMATVGNFGSHQRMDFTALGDTVNTASRTEGVNKYFGTRICCTAEVVARCGDTARFLPIADVTLKGKTVPTTLYTPVGDTPEDAAFARDYLSSYRLLDETEEAPVATGSAHPSVAAFDALAAAYPEQALPQLHAQRTAQGVTSRHIAMTDK